MSLAIERKNLILEKLTKDKKVVVSELALEFMVSEETIRRDLEKLEREGYAKKSYGGAILVEDNSKDMPFVLRQKNNLEAKRKIAALVSGLIEDGDHIFMDPSSTAVEVVKASDNKKNLSIITNSVEILFELSDKENWKVISTGGRLVENYLALVGPSCISSIEAFHADKVILSCKGLDMERGITDANEQFSEVKKKMLKCANTRILAVDHSKFNIVAFSQISKLTDIDIVVTDQKPSDDWLKFFKDNNIKLIY